MGTSIEHTENTQRAFKEHKKKNDQRNSGGTLRQKATKRRKRGKIGKLRKERTRPYTTVRDSEDILEQSSFQKYTSC